MSSLKILRINSELEKTLSNIILTETNDEFLKTVTITSCDVSKDLSYAKVYFTTMSNMDQKQAEKEMKEASDFFRKFVAKKMDLRQTPKLHFVVLSITKILFISITPIYIKFHVLIGVLTEISKCSLFRKSSISFLSTIHSNLFSLIAFRITLIAHDFDL